MRRGPPPGGATRSQTFLDLRRSGDADRQGKGAKCHANTGEAKSNSKGPEFGRGGQWSGEHRVIGTIAIGTICHGRKPRPSVLVCLPSGVAQLEKPWSL